MGNNITKKKHSSKLNHLPTTSSLVTVVELAEQIAAEIRLKRYIVTTQCRKTSFSAFLKWQCNIFPYSQVFGHGGLPPLCKCMWAITAVPLLVLICGRAGVSNFLSCRFITTSLSDTELLVLYLSVPDDFHILELATNTSNLQINSEVLHTSYLLTNKQL